MYNLTANAPLVVCTRITTQRKSTCAELWTQKYNR